MTGSPYTVLSYRYESANIVTVSHIKYYATSFEVAIFGYINNNKSNVIVYSFFFMTMGVYHKEIYNTTVSLLGGSV